MSEAFGGTPGSGSVLVYTVPSGISMRLEMLTFTLTTDATAGVHSALVTFTDKNLNAITGRLWDWNEGGPSMTLYYTYGIGLRPFNCKVTTGMMIPNHLPDTVLNPITQITVAAVNAAGATIAGDTITGVVLYGELFGANIDEGPTVPLLPGLLPGLAA